MDDDEDEETIDLMDGENDWSGLANFGDDSSSDDANIIGYSITDEETEAAAKKEAAAPEDEFMIGQAIDPSSVPEDMLKYEE